MLLNVSAFHVVSVMYSYILRVREFNYFQLNKDSGFIAKNQEVT